MNRPLRLYFLGLLLLGLIGLGIERLIVTDREAIEDLTERIATAIQAEDYDGLEALLAADFEFGDRDRGQTIDEVRRLVRTYHPMDVEWILYEIEVTGDDATAKGAVAATVFGRPQQMPIEAEFRKIDETWVLSKVPALPALRPR